MHIHLDPLGGAAGDMFVACLLHAFPEHRDAALHAAETLARTSCRIVAHDDGTLTGSRFEVAVPEPQHRHSHHHSHGDHAHAGHVPWRDIRARIEASVLLPGVRTHAAGIFAVLADAEARVHGVEPDAVLFHEVGATDSVADIVAAAVVIAAVGAASWSVGTLPLGGGTIQTAHGLMPVPAPATALLLEGFALRDDGVGGERVTPTGAAILRYLVRPDAAPIAGTLARSGYGFGTKTLPGISNCLRALVFETARPSAIAGHRELAVISFEVDDQSGEDLAMGLAHVRATAGVHDVAQWAALGKKSRFCVHVQVLAAPDALEAAVAACFRETTTIGLRTHMVQGRALPRTFARACVDGAEVAVKRAERPGGITTGKAEADHLGATPTHAARDALRRAAERTAEEADR